MITLPSGSKIHYDANNRIHRLDGPAIEYFSGRKQWWIHGEFIHDECDGKMSKENKLRFELGE